MKSSISFAVFAFCFLAVAAVLGLKAYDASPAVQITCLICMTVAFLAYCGVLAYQEVQRARDLPMKPLIAKVTNQAMKETRELLKQEWKDNYSSALETHKGDTKKALKNLEEKLAKQPDPETKQLVELITASKSAAKKGEAVSPETLEALIAFVRHQPETTIANEEKNS